MGYCVGKYVSWRGLRLQDFLMGGRARGCMVMIGGKTDHCILPLGWTSPLGHLLKC